MDECNICGTAEAKKRLFKPDPVFLCDRCHKIARRRLQKYRGRKKREVSVPTRKEWIEALCKSWNASRECFECQISHVKLDPDDSKSPFYPTLEHSRTRTGSVRFLVVASAINDMKSDLSLPEFRRAIPLMCRCLEREPCERQIRQLEKLLSSLKHWKR